MNHKLSLLCFIFLYKVNIICSYYYLKIFHNGPIVTGNTIKFNAILKYENNNPSGDFKYIWRDNALPNHHGIHFSKNNTFEWNVTYPHSDDYFPGNYEMELSVEKLELGLIWYELTSNRIGFNISGTLNGDLELLQKNKEIEKSKYVAANQELTLDVQLTEADLNYIKTNATDINTYIFIDCEYINETKSLTYKHNFTKINVEHLIETLMVVSFDPPVIVPTTMAPPNTTTTLKPNISQIIGNHSLISTTPNPITTTKSINGSLLEEISPNEVKPIQLSSTAPPPPTTTIETFSSNSTVKPSSVAMGFPLVCNGTSPVPRDKSKIYGYFAKKIKVEDAIHNINEKGNLWVQPGDMLTLQIKCNGTGPFIFCAKYVQGEYNVTGDESCVNEIVNKEQCLFNLEHYFKDHKPLYTLVAVIKNDVGKVVKAIGINMGTVIKQAQLSVIVVPVTASLIAVILIVFGLAYYIQTRHRFVIETADFDFSNTSTDLEYKTFTERLRDAISAAINREPEYLDQDSIWSPPSQGSGRQYGSMQ